MNYEDLLVLYSAKDNPYPFGVLSSVPQNPKWHPEGNVLTHTQMVVNHATNLAHLYLDNEEGKVLVAAAICHDVGKLWTTRYEEVGWTAKFHDNHSAQWVRDNLSFEKETVSLLCQEHMVSRHIGPKGIKRLLSRVGSLHKTLALLVKADHLGRPPLEWVEPEWWHQLLEG